MRHNKLLMIMIIIITAASLRGAIIDYYPRTIVAEYYPSASDDFNLRAYQGLGEVTMVYNNNILLPVRFYHSSISEELSAPSVDAYLNSITHLEFGSMVVNKNRISNPNLPIESGKPYKYLVEKEYYRPSPIKLEVAKSLAGDVLNVDIDITLLSGSDFFFDDLLRVVLIEDNVATGITNVAREIKETLFSHTEQNQTTRASVDFTINEDWNSDNLQVIVYAVYHNEVIQAASTYQNNQPYARGVFPNGRIDISPAQELLEAEYVGFFSFNIDADFTITTIRDNAPGDWYLAFCDDEGSCYLEPHDFFLQDGGSKAFHSNIYAYEEGMMDYHFLITSPAFFLPIILPARYISSGVDAIVVDGDGWEDYEQYAVAALMANDYTFGVWDTAMEDITAEAAAYNLIWVSGDKEPALSSSEIAFLKNHLDAGNSLFISGQHIGTYLTEHPYYKDELFYSEYLNAELVDAGGNFFELNGRTGDPVSDNLTITLNGTGSADNQDSPDVIRALNPQRGTEIFFYEDETGGAIRTLNRGLRGSTVYLGFGFEGINDDQTRSQLLTNSINYFLTTGLEDDVIAPKIPQTMQLFPGYPNPFRPLGNSAGTDAVLISYSIPGGSSANTSIAIYNVKGQLINSFNNLPLNQDKYGFIEWDGKDANGNLTANGIYFYVLANEQEEVVRKLSIIR